MIRNNNITNKITFNNSIYNNLVGRCLKHFIEFLKSYNLQMKNVNSPSIIETIIVKKF